MQAHYKQLIFNTIFWLITEIVLDLTGLDAIANYGEYIFANKNVTFHNPAGSIALSHLFPTT